jgi:hypothetical protein
MNHSYKVPLIICACLFALCSTAAAQRTTTVSKASDRGRTEAIMKGSGKATVIVVSSAAKVAWATTKFGAKYVAEPMAVKVAPNIAIQTLKTSGIAAKYVLPFAVKLSLL